MPHRTRQRQTSPCTLCVRYLLSADARLGGLVVKASATKVAQLELNPAATIRHFPPWGVKLSTPPSHSILTSGRPVPAPTLQCQAPGRVATVVARGILVSTPTYAWPCGVRDRIDWPGVSSLTGRILVWPAASIWLWQHISAAWAKQSLKATLSVAGTSISQQSPSVQTGQSVSEGHTYPGSSPAQSHHRLAGLVVKSSASGAEDPGFESRLRRDFSGSSHTSDWKISTPLATLPGAWHCRVRAGTGRPDVSILWLGEVESLICNFYLSVAARQIAYADPSLRYTSMLLGH